MSAAAISKPLPESPPERIKRFTVKEYEEMIRTNLIGENDPVELLEGWVVEKMPKKSPHIVANRLFSKTVEPLLPENWELISQDSVKTKDSVPEPDFAFLRGDIRDYLERLPSAKDAAMVVKVSESSLAQDRGRKKRIYARARIPIYWIINLVDSRIEVYSDPTGPAKKPTYRREEVYGLSDAVPLILDGKLIGQVKVEQLLP